VIDRQTQTLKIDGCNAFANAQARGYYLTDYTPEAVRAFARSADALAPVERLSLLGDEWWMVRSGRHDIDGYLDLAAALANDTSPVIASTIANRVSFTGDHVVDRTDQRAFEAWVRTRFGPTLTSLGIPGSTTDADDRQSRRATLLMLLGVTGNDTEVQQSARELAARYIDDPQSLPPTLAPAVLEVAAISGSAALYDRYMAQLQKLSNQPEEYYRFFNALAWFRDPALVQRTLDFTLTQAARSQDVGILIAGLMGQPTSRDAAWNFVKTHWTDLTRKLGTFQGIPEIVSGLGSFCSADKAGEMSLFFREHPVPSSSRTIQQAVEKVQTCAAMDRRQSAPLGKWLLGK
jgi:aminopeptidase N